MEGARYLPRRNPCWADWTQKKANTTTYGTLPNIKRNLIKKRLKIPSPWTSAAATARFWLAVCRFLGGQGRKKKRGRERNVYLSELAFVGPV